VANPTCKKRSATRRPRVNPRPELAAAESDPPEDCGTSFAGDDRGYLTTGDLARNRAAVGLRREWRGPGAVGVPGGSAGGRARRWGRANRGFEAVPPRRGPSARASMSVARSRTTRPSAGSFGGSLN